MPAYPFGGHPTLARYMKWALDVGVTSHTLPGAVLFVNNKTGRHAILDMNDQSERLTASIVAYLDRRLGVDSPFPKV